MHELRHGYTLADVDRVARSAARNAGAYASDFVERFDLAYSATVAALYEAEHWPAEHSLFDAACQGIWRALHSSEHVWGIVPDRKAGYRTMPAFERYWRWHAQPTPSPEQVVVDATAVGQILPRLTALQREALATYAAHDCSIEAAAEALHLPVKTMSARIDYARKTFLAFWHEGEAPSRKWRKEGTRRPEGELVPCGTQGAYFRHRRRGEPVDEACRLAHSAKVRAHKQKNRR